MITYKQESCQVGETDPSVRPECLPVHKFLKRSGISWAARTASPHRASLVWRLARYADVLINPLSWDTMFDSAETCSK